MTAVDVVDLLKRRKLLFTSFANSHPSRCADLGYVALHVSLKEFSSINMKNTVSFIKHFATSSVEFGENTAHTCDIATAVKLVQVSFGIKDTAPS